MDMQAVIEAPAEEAERLIRDPVRVLTPADRTVAVKGAADLHLAVATPQSQQTLSDGRRIRKRLGFRSLIEPRGSTTPTGRRPNR